MVAIPVLVRLLVLAAVGAVAPDTLRAAPEIGLWGLGPERMLESVLLFMDAGGSGRGRGAEEIVLCRLMGDTSRAAMRGSVVAGFCPVMNS